MSTRIMYLVPGREESLRAQIWRGNDRVSLSHWEEEELRTADEADLNLEQLTKWIEILNQVKKEMEDG